MVNFRMKMRLTEGTHDKIFNTLIPIIEPTRSQEGCLEIELFKSLGNEGWFLLSQRWADQISLTKYIKGNRFRSILIATELLSEPPQLSLSYITHDMVLENIHELMDLLGNSDHNEGY